MIAIEKDSLSLIRLVLAFSIMYFQIVLKGVQTGFSSVMISQLRDDNSDIKINSNQISWIASSIFLTCPIGAIISGWIMDRYGRLRSMQLSMIPLIICFMWLWLAKSITDLYIARITVGLTLGSGASAICLYICETCTPSSRSFFLSLFNINQALGMILSTALMGWMTWRSTAEVFFIVTVVLTVLLFLVPESPGWLLNKGRQEESAKICKWYGVPTPDISSMSTAENKPHRISLKTLTRPEVWKPATLSVTFFFLQSATGFSSSVIYLVDYTHRCKIPFDSVNAAIVLSVVRLIGSSINSFILFNLKKKTLICISALGMVVSTATIATMLRIYEDPLQSPFPWLTFACLCVYVLSAMLGVSPLPFTFSSEVFPTSVGGVMMGITNSIAFGFMFLASNSFLMIVDAIGMEMYLWLCMGFSVALVLFGWFLLPETKNKTKDEITEYFIKKKNNNIRDA
ncbi:facilitated trehalose transporter Tret1-like isoform X2 [Daktulosphaira vitifoliae]|uniref:facilitated trehalose transporter Tret1-like isoform X2 n=1 Tax=Daktulosphaira vitifoliae TaxID=58002 RepID=UPI0021AA5E24|nr:facilitated trehalose transporter Tret1-like isoform X2 [Daktulosphaira vitifoliae]XP_050522840.1 facilitated trehalose transporter Tret1-like isoform X2 [Daktulosphaira vitifoliae]